MEFGLATLCSVPRYRYARDPDAEHTAIINDMNYIIAADRLGYKYGQITEHHFLDEYSHMSAPEVCLGYLAHATCNIHLLAGIFSPMPHINHPARLAERATMLDHLSGGRVEIATGRGAGSFETLAFMSNLQGMDETRPVWEDVVPEIPKMWTQDTYEGHASKYWNLPARRILPRPWKAPHPPLWYAAGNVSSWEAAGRKGLGVLGFSIDNLKIAEKAVKAYKAAVKNAEPIGSYTNDYLMAVVFCAVSYDRERAFSWMMGPEYAYNVSQMYRYHDTFPRAPGVPKWPEVLAPFSREAVREMQKGGTVVGTPEDAVAVFKQWQEVGVDGVLVSCPPDHLAATETLELIGRHVIPEIDKDPVHRTERFRDGARR
jgi:alkanesulfonate monooxygenase SsuD/methylene tetrahydromethanopterin reductase-like flavin-dependent oxidoreductase (luciferase family)